MKNRMLEFRKSGSVRDGDGNVLIYSAMTPVTGEKEASRAFFKTVPAHKKCRKR